jgi:hypothetical protein
MIIAAIRRWRFKRNDRRTRKDFIRVSHGGTIFYAAASPEEFFMWASRNNWDVFRMACLQAYKQDPNGTWKPIGVVPFETHADLERHPYIMKIEEQP